jgi:LmbE family N-acetylglucosaminyl deacetylase
VLRNYSKDFTRKTVGIVGLTRGELGTRGSNKKRDQEANAAAKTLGVQVRENLEMRDGCK